MSAKQDWPWWKVKAEVERRGGSLTKIANELGVTPATVTAVKTVPVPRAQQAIANFIGVAPTAIWPTRYSAHGLPVNPTAWRRKFGNLPAKCRVA